MSRWVLITGWIIFGSFVLILIIAALKAIANNFFIGAIFPLLIALILIRILWRATAAKLVKNQSKSRRK